jgi:hypothetical protein
MFLEVFESLHATRRRAGVVALLWLAAASLTACGGGGSSETTPPVPVRLVGEVLGGPEQVPTSEFKISAGYSGQPETGRALLRLGHAPMVDMLFMLPGAYDANTSPPGLRPDAQEKLLAFLAAQRDLLQPGVRVLIKDEVYWNPAGSADSAEVLQPQLDALGQAVALVRRHAPQLSVGITVTPYGSQGRPVTMDYIGRAIKLVDWVGTDPYWFGDVATVEGLNQWTRDFAAFAKAAHPHVETWLIAQAFKDPAWSTVIYNDLMRTQLSHANRYDHVVFFGWQFVSELPASYAGKYFTPDTRAIYKDYLR